MPFDLLQRKRTHFALWHRGAARPLPLLSARHRGKPTELSAAEQVRFGGFTGFGRSMGSSGRSLRAGGQPRLSLLV